MVASLIYRNKDKKYYIFNKNLQVVSLCGSSGALSGWKSAVSMARSDKA
jgi:hypothetical protein